MQKIKKVVLAYSGGLDTSIILRWLKETYGCEVVTFTADLGQGGELEPARKKAEMMGVKEIFIEDLREEFVRDYVFPMFRANTLYEGTYLLGTSIARPLIAKRQIEIAIKAMIFFDIVDQRRLQELGHPSADPDPHFKRQHRQFLAGDRVARRDTQLLTVFDELEKRSGFRLERLASLLQNVLPERIRFIDKVNFAKNLKESV